MDGSGESQGEGYEQDSSRFRGVSDNELDVFCCGGTAVDT